MIWKFFFNSYYLIPQIFTVFIKKKSYLLICNILYLKYTSNQNLKPHVCSTNYSRDEGKKKKKVEGKHHLHNKLESKQSNGKSSCHKTYLHTYIHHW